ncbi:MAG: nitroreductase [Pseudomonadota bacterium]
MKVSDAIWSRTSCRAFTDEPVDPAALRRIVGMAARAPSGGNVQPWRVYVLGGEALKALVEDVADKARTQPMGAPTEYDIYPSKLKDPYRGWRYKLGEDMYSLLGIPREDKIGRLRQLGENFRLFGAPVGLFMFLDRQMGPPQWSDAGMYLQSVMLLAREEGLHTCAQEAWAMWAEEVRAHTGAPEEEMLFCGMSIGHRDEDAPVNQLRADRAALDEFAAFKGI